MLARSIGRAERADPAHGETLVENKRRRIGVGVGACGWVAKGAGAQEEYGESVDLHGKGA